MAAIIEGRFGFWFFAGKNFGWIYSGLLIYFRCLWNNYFLKALCVFQLKSRIDIWKESQNVPMKFRPWWIFWKPATAHNSAPSAILGILEGWSFGFLCNFAVSWKISVTNPKLYLCAKRYRQPQIFIPGFSRLDLVMKSLVWNIWKAADFLPEFV